MSTRRIVMAVLVTMLMSALTAAPAAAAKPIKPPPAAPAERPLTAEEQAAAAAKFAAAQAYVASVAASGADLVGLSCVTPTATTSAAGEASTDGVGDATIQGCYVPQGFLTVYARDQDNGAYCAPATGQVIANYTWGVASWANRYSQAQIAGWMGTVNGGTDAFGVARGLETATWGAPRRPAIWNWLVHDLIDSNKNGDTGDELFTALRANISGSAMPLAIPVKPHDPNALYWLSSWPRAVNSPGHWIAAYGWVGIYSKGSNYSRLYFTDSSKDEGGSTGKFYNSVLSIKWMIDHHTKRFVW